MKLNHFIFLGNNRREHEIKSRLNFMLCFRFVKGTLNQYCLNIGMKMKYLLWNKDYSGYFKFSTISSIFSSFYPGFLTEHISQWFLIVQIYNVGIFI